MIKAKIDKRDFIKDGSTNKQKRKEIAKRKKYFETMHFTNYI